ncbi:histone modifying enzyme [Lithospermum erythrorhizon]|uniref:Histone modifying enzyme n=1 Tax=Lithospermum erythrorhizon TaxID=34254 RepID=A0AAV3Q817_LITER
MVPILTGRKYSSSSSFVPQEDDDVMQLYGSDSGWVEARTYCEHLGSLFTDLTHIPSPDTLCKRCQHPEENWVCLSCKEVFCSRFVNKHMLEHYQQANHCIALSFSDLSVWCFSCDAYLDAQVILQLRPAHETAYILKFGEAPPSRAAEVLQLGDNKTDN